jgi:apolipoprotein N-acyltransferase
MYAVALAYPAYVHWLTFFFLVPLFWVVIQAPVRCSDGFVWGLLFFSLHWYSCMLVVLERGHGWLRWFIVPFFILYSALYSDIWFFMAQSSARMIPDNKIWQGFCWVSLTTAYFLWMRHALFWPFGGFFGYGLSFPLVPLAMQPQWLMGMMQGIESSFLLLMLIAWSWSCARLCVRRGMMDLVCAGFFSIPFLIGWTGQLPQEKTPDYLVTLGYVAPPHNVHHPLDCAQEIQSSIALLLEQFPHVRYIVLPESSFPYPINEHPEAAELLVDAVRCDELSIAIGTYRSQGDNLFNCLSCVSIKTLIEYYDKKTPVPFVEYVPSPWNNFSCLRSLFFSENCYRLYPSTSSGRAEGAENYSPKRIFRPLSFAGITWHPMICSDLFLNPLAHSQQPILCIVNDSWFPSRSMRGLMALFARYYAIEVQQNLLYVGHFGASLFHRAGAISPLQGV